VAELQAKNSSSAALTGDLNAASVVALVEPGKQLIQQSGDEWQLDMASVGRVSSAAVALLLEWLRTANSSGVAMTVVNVPENLLPIIQVSDLEAVFDGVLNAA